MAHRRGRSEGGPAVKRAGIRDDVRRLVRAGEGQTEGWRQARMKITADGIDLGMVVFRDDDEMVTLGDLVAAALASEFVTQAGTELEPLRDRVAAITDEEIREQVRKRIADALDGPPGRVPVTLADAIQAEAKAQIELDFERYQGSSTPLRQVVASEVYVVLNDEATRLVREARDTIREQIRAEFGKIVDRELGLGRLA